MKYYLEAVVSGRLKKIEDTSSLQRLQVLSSDHMLQATEDKRLHLENHLIRLEAVGTDELETRLETGVQRRGWWARASAAAVGLAPMFMPTARR